MALSHSIDCSAGLEAPLITTLLGLLCGHLILPWTAWVTGTRLHCLCFQVQKGIRKPLPSTEPPPCAVRPSPEAFFSFPRTRDTTSRQQSVTPCCYTQTASSRSHIDLHPRLRIPCYGDEHFVPALFLFAMYAITRATIGFRSLVGSRKPGQPVLTITGLRVDWGRIAIVLQGMLCMYHYKSTSCMQAAPSCLLP